MRSECDLRTNESAHGVHIASYHSKCLQAQDIFTCRPAYAMLHPLYRAMRISKLDKPAPWELSKQTFSTLQITANSKQKQSRPGPPAEP